MSAVYMTEPRAQALRVMLAADGWLRNYQIMRQSGASLQVVTALVKKLEFLGWAVFKNDMPRRSGLVRPVKLAPHARQYIELLIEDFENPE